jgi:hypothetical protein
MIATASPAAIVTVGGDHREVADKAQVEVGLARGYLVFFHPSTVRSQTTRSTRPSWRMMVMNCDDA